MSYIKSTSSPGTTNSGTTTVDFGSTGSTDVTTNVTGQTGILTTSSVSTVILVKSSSNHTADEHWVENPNVAVGNIVAGTGFTIYASTNNFPLVGIFNISWMWV